MQQVDLALLLIDGREMVTFADVDVAQWLKDTLPKSSKTLLVANKCEALSSEVTPMGSRIRDNLMESYRLGFGAPIAISAETGDGMIDLCEALLPILDTPDEDASIEVEEPIKVAIMGLPNVVSNFPFLVSRFLNNESRLGEIHSNELLSAIRAIFSR